MERAIVQRGAVALVVAVSVLVLVACVPRPSSWLGESGYHVGVIGDSLVMVGSAGPENPAMPAMIHLYVEDCDAVYERALAAGATSEREPTDQFYGDRSGGVRDQGGNLWWIATHVEDVPEDEMAKRIEEMRAAQQAG